MRKPGKEQTYAITLMQLTLLDVKLSSKYLYVNSRYNSLVLNTCQHWAQIYFINPDSKHVKYIFVVLFSQMKNLRLR